METQGCLTEVTIKNQVNRKGIFERINVRSLNPYPPSLLTVRYIQAEAHCEFRLRQQTKRKLRSKTKIRLRRLRVCTWGRIEKCQKCKGESMNPHFDNLVFQCFCFSCLIIFKIRISGKLSQQNRKKAKEVLDQETYFQPLCCSPEV